MPSGKILVATQDSAPYLDGDPILVRADTEGQPFCAYEEKTFLVMPISDLTRDDFRDLTGPVMTTDTRTVTVTVTQQRGRKIDWRANMTGATVPDEGGRAATEADVLDTSVRVQMPSRTRTVIETRP